MRSSRSPRRLVIAASLLFGIAVLGASFLFRGRKIRRFPYTGKPLGEVEYKALGSRPGWRTSELEVASGVTLRGLVRRPIEASGPFVLFLNGNSGQMLTEGQHLLSNLCTEPSWGGAVWAYRGYDGSSGTPNPKALEEDAWQMYQSLLRSEKLSPRAVHVVAFSLGTSLATALAARAKDRPFASMVLLAPMTELDMGERFQLFRDRYETLKHLDAIATPTLVIHGTEDQTLPVDGGRLVASRLGARGRFEALPGAGHFDLLDSTTVTDAIRAFIAEHAR